MLAMVALDRRRTLAMPVRSPLSRVTPALSIATSVPEPMAMPASAAARAGVSFTPSPAMATIRPSPFSRATTALLPSGSTSASTSLIPSRRATAWAVVRLSPVSMTMRMPSACSSWRTGAVEGLIGSAMAKLPAACPSRPK